MFLAVPDDVHVHPSKHQPFGKLFYQNSIKYVASIARMSPELGTPDLPPEEQRQSSA